MINTRAKLLILILISLLARGLRAHAEVNCPALFAAGKDPGLYQKLILEKLSQGRASRFPHLVFTAGGFGAGKTTMLARLNQSGSLHLDNYVALDVDEIKEMLPEYQDLKKSDPLNAASRIHDLSGCIAKQVFDQAFILGKNILVDGSMRLTELWRAEFARVRQDYPNYFIYILFVDASDSELLRRVRGRATFNGRHIAEAKVLQAAEQARASFKILSELADVTYEFENETELNLKRRVLRHRISNCGNKLL